MLSNYRIEHRFKETHTPQVNGFKPPFFGAVVDLLLLPPSRSMAPMAPTNIKVGHMAKEQRVIGEEIENLEEKIL